jgi:hypothetical protein
MQDNDQTVAYMLADRILGGSAALARTFIVRRPSKTSVVCAKLLKLYGIAPRLPDCRREKPHPECLRGKSNSNDDCAAVADIAAMLQVPRT